MSRELEQQEHPSVKDLCDGYGPEKGWCGDPGHPYVGDCPCREEHEAYERGKRDAEARIVAWLQDRALNHVRLRGDDVATPTMARYRRMLATEVGKAADAIERGEHR